MSAALGQILIASSQFLCTGGRRDLKRILLDIGIKIKIARVLR